MGPKTSLEGCGNSRHHGIRSLGGPSRRESIYRLSYRGPIRGVSSLCGQNTETPGDRSDVVTVKTLWNYIWQTFRLYHKAWHVRKYQCHF